MPKDAIRKRLRQEIEAVGKQAEIDRASYVSVRELVDMLGPNIKSTEQLSGIISTMGMKTVATRSDGRNTWLTEEQAKQVIARVLSHPIRFVTGDAE